MNIAVLGGGVFGCTAALRLAADGHHVTLLESANTLLTGASHNNVNRVHLGFHYPRDMATAQQCTRGFQRFCMEFPTCIRGGFPSAYFIAEQGSRTSPSAFLRFCRDAGLAYRQVSTFKPRVDNVSLGIECDEVVYDAEALSLELTKRCRQMDVCVLPSTTVESIARTSSSIGVDTGTISEFDAVVNCCYATQNKFTAQLGFHAVRRQYEYTAVAIIDAPWEPAAITVMDGPFVTLMPHGPDRHLLYHVDESVLARIDGIDVPQELASARLKPEEYASWFRRIVERAAVFIPEVRSARLVDVLQGPRVVLAGQDRTDARPSLVTAYAPYYVTVFGGKVDTCLDTADEVAAHLRR